MGWKGANIDCLTDNPADTINQLNELHAQGGKLIRWQFVNNPRWMAEWSIAEFRQWLENRLWVLDQTIPTAIANQQPIIIDFHHAIGGLKNRKWPLFYRADLQKEFKNILGYVAARYANNPAIFAIEFINEPFPRKNSQLTKLYQEWTEHVRASGWNKYVVVGHKTADCDNMADLQIVYLPKMNPANRREKRIPDPAVYYSFHDYKPSAVLDPRSNPFIISDARIESWLRYPLRFARKYPFAKILVGEFGCLAAAGKGAVQEEWVYEKIDFYNRNNWDWLWLGKGIHPPAIFDVKPSQFENMFRTFRR